mmetsp:Transcript_110142/g.322260  ORF Transcript_110142/g.322260 Transcript_110142/m.322260 type:complete len:265 (-) Transcript_110142:377-1171(-)
MTVPKCCAPSLSLSVLPTLASAVTTSLLVLLEGWSMDVRSSVELPRRRKQDILPPIVLSWESCGAELLFWNLKSSCSCAAGRVTLDSILYLCHFARRSSAPQLADHESSAWSSGGNSKSAARARSCPCKCCNSAIAVTSSTPAGTDFEGAMLLCCRVHQSSPPIGPWRLRSPSLTSGSCGLLQPCFLHSRPMDGGTSGKPSAMQRKPVSASLRTDQRAKVFQGVVRPFSTRSPALKSCPSKTGPTTSMSSVWWSRSLCNTATVH